MGQDPLPGGDFKVGGEAVKKGCNIMTHISREELLEKIFHDDYKNLKGKRLRMTRLRVPGKEVCLAHVLCPSDSSVYQNLSLHIGVHEGEDHRGEAIGLIRFTPWEAVVAAADIATKSADVEIGFMDRFCGSLIITGSVSEVEAATNAILAYVQKVLGYAVCEITKT